MPDLENNSFILTELCYLCSCKYCTFDLLLPSTAPDLFGDGAPGSSSCGQPEERG